MLYAWNNTFPWKIRIAMVGANTPPFPLRCEEVADFFKNTVYCRSGASLAGPG